MKNLDILYREEMHYLKVLSDIIAKENPALIPFIAPQHSDAFVEKTFEAFALLSAEFNKKLSSAFPEITVDYLKHICPILINPIPITTVLEFDNTNQKIIDGIILPKESRINFTVEQIEGEFRTCRDLLLTAISIENKSCYTSTSGSEIILTCRYNGKKLESKHQNLTLYLGNDIKLARKLQFYFKQKLQHSYLMINGSQYIIPKENIHADYPDVHNRILPTDNDQNWPIQSFIEGFYLPHVYDFITLTLPHELLQINEYENGFELRFIFTDNLDFTNEMLQGSFITNCVPAYGIKQVHMNNIVLRTDYQKTELQLSSINSDIYAIHSIKLFSKEGNLSTQTVKPISEYHPRYRLFNPKVEKQYFYELNQVIENKNKSTYTLSLFDHAREFVKDLDGLGCSIEYSITNVVDHSLLSKTLICDPISASSDMQCTNISPTSRYYSALIDSGKHWPMISFLAQSPFFLNEIDVIKTYINAFAFHEEHDINLQRKIKKFAESLFNIESKASDRLINNRIRRGFQIKLLIINKTIEDEEVYFLTNLLLILFSNTITDKTFILMDVFDNDGNYILSLPQRLGQRKSL